MSALLPAAAAAAPLTGWMVHTLWMRRQLDKARRDPLTGLHTRAGFENRAARLLSKQSCAVAVLDLDGFKALNDTHGHAAGDAALVHVGARLAWRNLWLTARLGGDEFALVLPPRQLGFHLGRLHADLTRLFEHEGAELAVGASIGAITVPRGASLSAALRQADELMYAVKLNDSCWAIKDLCGSTWPTVNGRRAGRSGTHTPEGRAAA